jgi:hypothetical protein
VHAPKSTKDNEAQAAAVEECKKLGKRNATIVETRKTVNDRFPMTYIFVCNTYWLRLIQPFAISLVTIS